MNISQLRIATLVAFTTLALSASAQQPQGYMLIGMKEVVVSSYDFQNDKLVATTNGRDFTIQTNYSQFFVFCDGSVRHLTEQQAERRLRPGSRLKVELVRRNGRVSANRILLIPAGP